MEERRAVLCADDYGLAPGVGHAVRDLITRRRLAATSCMTTTRHWPEEAERLRDFADKADVGLHLTLTDQVPLGRLPGIAPDGRFPPLGRLIRQAYARRIDVGEIAAECERQLDAFEERFGRPPAFVDGHHHVHQLPGIGDAVLALYERRLRRHGAYIRLTDEPLPEIWRRGIAVARTSVISGIGRNFARRARAMGIPGNLSFRGVRRFTQDEDFPRMFERFMEGPRERTIVMCHPALPDDALAAVDHVTAPRGEEYRYLASDDCGRLLTRLRVSIVRFSA